MNCTMLLFSEYDFRGISVKLAEEKTIIEHYLFLKMSISTSPSSPGIINVIVPFSRYNRFIIRKEFCQWIYGFCSTWNIRSIYKGNESSECLWRVFGCGASILIINLLLRMLWEHYRSRNKLWAITLSSKE